MVQQEKGYVPVKPGNEDQSICLEDQFAFENCHSDLNVVQGGGPHEGHRLKATDQLEDF